MDLRVLGCSGGVGVDLRTTTLLIDSDILIDAGTGLGDLSLEQMSQIKHIFVTHSHLDHVVGIPLLVDTIFERITEPVVVHAQAETLKALQMHIFNNVIWPDFSCIPYQTPVLKYQLMEPGEVVDMDGRQFEMIPVNHSVPGVGYRVQGDNAAFAFSGDTTTNDTFWEALNKHDDLDLLIVEAAFSNDDKELCKIAGHYCAELLGADIKKLKHRPDVYITHNKPGFESKILDECNKAITAQKIYPLQGHKTFTL